MKSFARALCAVAALACATALYAAEPVSIQQAARTGDVSAVYAFVADGVDINAADADGLTPLHWAADSAEAETAQQLLALGANANARDHAGRTPLHYAARAGQSSIVEQLFAHGASISAADVRGNTPLHLAASRARPAVAGLLIAAGADVNARNEAGQTPLHVVGDQTRPDVDDVELQAVVRDVAQVLMTAGADPAARDGDGNVAWPHAAPVSEPRQPSGYPTYDQIAATLLTKANTYPTLCQRFDLGTSSTTQHLYALKLTSNVGVEADKPEFNWVSTMHGDEVTGVVLCLNMIDYLLANYGSISRVTNLVDNVEIWFVPCMNPYGYANNTRYNANGADLNRSFPEGSGSSPDPNTPTGRQPEVATIMNWGYAHSFTLGANYHGGSLVCNYPYDNDNLGSVFSPTPDEDLFQYISLQYSSHNLPMYNSTSFTHGITNGAAWYAITGGMQDWNYRYVGANHVTIEVSETKSPAYSQMPTFWSQNQESMLSYMETCLIGVRGIVTDATTGAPLAATVTVAGRNHPIYTDPDVGDYHRMLLPGTYQLTFAAAGHETRTLPATVVSGPATRLDVVLGGPPRITAPNGGESLTAGAPTNVTWTGAPTTQFQVQQSSNYGQTGPTTDGFESGTLGSAYTSGGNAPWFVTTGSPHAGTYSARAGAITHSQTTWMTCTAQAGPISFWHKVSSEGGYDWFNFYIDGAQILHKSGTVSWTQYTTTLAAGTHTLKWEYTKDAGVSGGADTVWIDDLTLTGDATTWTDIIALTPVGAASTAWTPTTVSSTNKVRARTYFGGSSYSSWDESDATFSVVAAPQGACCATNGSCAVTTQALCTGTYQGDGTTCTPNPCPQPQGACCAANGSCTVTTQALCTGTYQGDGTTCTPNPCPQPQGACCATNGSCTVTTQALCTGTYQGDGTSCTPNPCPPAGCAGDMNCNGSITFADIDLFVEALGGESAWTHTCPWINADCNGDHNVTFADIDPFVGLIGTTCP